ncbi:DsbA family oxidoreductase [Sandaracinobacter neustonicus]|uniref:DsbA family oxidoreductase n=1 Tax=Sandaracinobacter neustonicus TaxID=1715348 RepID=A0A501XUU4_9SPHN|nr:DsbA family oxidoreductase [Sandaracinobacter neustonicus]TPE64458.1 DsbA family oxidoreductase [Sandaracinobacter neustonicus]
MAGRIQIDIISDVVCPWCFIGYRQLERALEIAGLEGDIRWHPFELNPQMPPEGEDVAEHIARKYGATPDQSAATRHSMKAIAEPLGIDFSARSTRIWNTLDAHRLLHWAKDSGKQTDLKLALFNAYFSRGENVSDRQLLLNAVEAAGLDREGAAAVLNSDLFANEVRALEAHWQEMGISGVPAMILAEKGLVMGAQEPERLAIALKKMAALTEPS